MDGPYIVDSTCARCKTLDMDNCIAFECQHQFCEDCKTDLVPPGPIELDHCPICLMVMEKDAVDACTFQYPPGRIPFSNPPVSEWHCKRCYNSDRSRRVAKIRCLTCELSLCDDHRNQHKQSPADMRPDHFVLPIETYRLMRDSKFHRHTCSRHPDQPLNLTMLWCKKCKALLCQVCEVEEKCPATDDSPHNALGMDTIAMDIVGEIQTELDKIKAGLYGWAVEADQVATAAKDSLDKAEINIKNIFNKALNDVRIGKSNPSKTCEKVKLYNIAYTDDFKQKLDTRVQKAQDAYARAQELLYRNKVDIVDQAQSLIGNLASVKKTLTRTMKLQDLESSAIEMTFIVPKGTKKSITMPSRSMKRSDIQTGNPAAIVNL